MDYTASKYESASSMPSATYMHPAGSWQLCTVWSLVHSWWVWTSQIKLQINVQFMGSITTVRCVSTAIRQLQLPHQYLYDLHSKKQHKTTNNASDLCWVLWLNAQTTVLCTSYNLWPITYNLLHCNNKVKKWIQSICPCVWCFGWEKAHLNFCTLSFVQYV